MPRGYLKHADGTSRKASRGGGSHQPTKENRQRKREQNKGKAFYDGTKTITSEHEDCVNTTHDCGFTNKTKFDFIRAPSAVCTNKKKAAAPKSYPEQECPVCFETKPVVGLMKGCRWHEAACLGCMREMYVVQAQKSSRNYPLRCFHPQCRLPIQATQLVKHNLIRNDAEFEQHFRLTESGKGQKQGHGCIHCPYCDYPRSYVHHEDGKNRTFNCRECKKNFMVSPFAQVIQAMETYDENARNRSWAQCPACKNLVYRERDEDWDDVLCACGASFSWTRSQQQAGFRYPFGRPANHGVTDLLYLYW